MLVVVLLLLLVAYLHQLQSLPLHSGVCVMRSRIFSYNLRHPPSGLVGVFRFDLLVMMPQTQHDGRRISLSVFASLGFLFLVVLAGW